MSADGEMVMVEGHGGLDGGRSPNCCFSKSGSVFIEVDHGFISPGPKFVESWGGDMLLVNREGA